jgi:hypothetical protein
MDLGGKYAEMFEKQAFYYKKASPVSNEPDISSAYEKTEVPQ